MTRYAFYEHLESRGLALSEIQKQQFHRFFELLVEWNQKINLTSITEESGVYAKHFYDSLDPFLEMDMSSASFEAVASDEAVASNEAEIKTVCDVGTGAGFPGIPLAIAYPEIQFELIDSLGKRIEFLNFCVTELGITNVKAHHVRAEDFASENRESFDLVTSRAVARLHILAELCAPLVAVGGQFVTLKGPAGYDELIEANKGPERLGLEYVKATQTNMDEVGQRVNLYFKKVCHTPTKYPRQFGQIKKKPLV